MMRNMKIDRLVASFTNNFIGDIENHPPSWTGLLVDFLRRRIVVCLVPQDLQVLVVEEPETEALQKFLMKYLHEQVLVVEEPETEALQKFLMKYLHEAL
ncbi:hypothetical protein M8J75_010658 [Diaphorina citri]|nr:hypothetical protein M8J75_010658 [Diaphorina citri]